MIDFFVRGGWVMYPILLCSLLALAVFLERLWYLRPSKLIPAPFTTAVIQAVSKGDIPSALSMCDASSGSPAARIAKAGLLQFGEKPEMIRFMVSEVGSQEAVRLERYQSVIATVAYVAPLLGLLGTVAGMIKAFEVIAGHHIGDPARLAAGISEALITTYFGLTVAIPAVIMHKIVQGRVAQLSLEMDKEAVTLTEYLVKASQRAAECDRAAER